MNLLFQKQFKSEKRGFTLVELLVSVSLFVIVILLAIGTLLNLARANDRSQAVLVALNNLDFAMEQMARNLRTGTQYQNIGEISSIQYMDSHNTVVSYQLLQNSTTGHGAVVRTKAGIGPIALTAPEIDIKQLSFYIADTDPNDNRQPRILITVGGRTTIPGLKDDEQVEFHLQTTVSQRSPDLQ